MPSKNTVVDTSKTLQLSQAKMERLLVHIYG
jgi:hypothetical protein